MLSIGIRCGKGFDRDTIKKLIDIGKRPYEFDVLILGNNAGGLACAREAARLGKKVALVYWKIPTPGIEEGHDEDRRSMADVLYMSYHYINERTLEILNEDGKGELFSAVKGLRRVSSRSVAHDMPNTTKFSKWWRKVRASKLDLVNSIANLSTEGLTYMHEVAVANDVFRNKYQSRKALSWNRMMDRVLDYSILRNWNICTDYLKDKVSFYEAVPLVKSKHSVRIHTTKEGEKLITAEVVISALEKHNTFPNDVTGAREFGVNLDDFYRLSTSPGKTLVVGAGSRGLECAGILSSFNLPVVVVDRLPVLREGDPEIVAMLTKGMESRGVRFMEKKSLLSIKKNRKGNALIAAFSAVDSSGQSFGNKYSEEFDTVLFTTKEKCNPEGSEKTAIQLELEKLTGKKYPPTENSMFQDFIVIPDRPDHVSVTESIGKLLALHLVYPEAGIPQLKLMARFILTPLEYAFFGISEVDALRFGKECIQVFAGNISTEDIIRDAREKFCYAKMITMTEKDMVVGLHLYGRDAAGIMTKILDPEKERMMISDLHPVLKSLQPQKIRAAPSEVVLKEIEE